MSQEAHSIIQMLIDELHFISVPNHIFGFLILLKISEGGSIESQVKHNGGKPKGALEIDGLVQDCSNSIWLFVLKDFSCEQRLLN